MARLRPLPQRNRSIDPRSNKPSSQRSLLFQILLLGVLIFFSYLQQYEYQDVSQWLEFFTSTASTTTSSRLSTTSNLISDPIADQVAYWNDYRLGDAINGGGIPVAPGCERYPDSIICDYYNRTDLVGNYPVLVQVVKEWTQKLKQTNPHFTLPEETDIVVHLRLGDALCLAGHDPECDERFPARREANQRGLNVSDCWNYQYDCFHNKWKPYAFSKDYYLSVVQRLQDIVQNDPPNKKRKLKIVSSSTHFQRNNITDTRDTRHSTDQLYKDQFLSFMLRNGFEAEFVKHDGYRTPDEDFLYLVNAKVFVRGGGRYSDTATRVVRRLGNTVIEPKIIK